MDNPYIPAVISSISELDDKKPSLKTLIVPFVISLFIVIAGTIVSIGLVLPGLLLIPIFVVGSIPYTIVATVFAVKKRKAASIKIASGNYVSTNSLAETFSTKWQRYTLVTNFILTLNALIFLSIYFVSESGTTVYIICGTLAAMGAGIMIVCNVPFIYKKAAIEAEEYSLFKNNAASSFIKTNRVWSWGTWYFYTFVAAYLLVNFLISNV